MHVSQLDTDERRGEFREQLYLDGSIVSHSGTMKLSCLVPDWSALGAKLIVPQAEQVPDRFVLVIERLGWRANAIVTRRLDGAIGVKFENVNG